MGEATWQRIYQNVVAQNTLAYGQEEARVKGEAEDFQKDLYAKSLEVEGYKYGLENLPFSNLSLSFSFVKQYAIYFIFGILILYYITKKGK